MVRLSDMSGEAREEESDLVFRASLTSAPRFVLGNYFIYVEQRAGLSSYRDLLWDVSDSSGMQ